ncbi:MAG: hypothetical protein ABEK29_11085 [Bradymonadaceae bacterium]
MQVRDWVVAVFVVLAAFGCQEGPKVVSSSESVETGGMTIEVTGYDVRKLEVIDGKRTHEYGKPVLAMKVKLTNNGKKAFRYAPQHGVQQATEANSPLLYYDPGKGKSIPPSNKSSINISGVVLEKGHPAGQVPEPTQIKPDQSLTDLYLFKVPDKKQASLILSVPPKVHRGDKPVLFRVPYKEKSPEGLTWHGKDETANFDGIKFTVDNVETTYIEINPSDAKKAYSTDPLLKVGYKIVNDSDETVTYNPGHHARSGRRGAELHAGGEAYARVKFSGNTQIVDQVTNARKLKSGESLTDFSVFERPGKDVKALKFEYPASRFGRGGLVRFNLPYKYKDPEKPEALTKAESDEE